MNNKALLRDLIANNPDLSSNKILQLFGFKKLLETMNPRELRAMFSGYHDPSSLSAMQD